MSRYDAEHESSRLYAEEDVDNAQLSKLLLEREHIQIAIDEIKARKVARNHTFGTLNPGRSMGYGVAS